MNVPKINSSGKCCQGPLTHHDANVSVKEELTPTLENIVVLTLQPIYIPIYLHS